MHPASQIFGIENAGLDVLAMEVGTRIRWRIAVKGKIAGLGADQNFIAMKLSGVDQLFERGPDVSFRALMPVVNRSIENIDAGLKAGFNRCCVGLIGGVTGIAEVSSQSDG